MMFKQVDHPYSALLKYAKCLKGDKPKLQKMVGLSTLSNNKSLLQIDNIEFQVQMSWTFVNDSLCTTLCLQWEPEVRFFCIIRHHEALLILVIIKTSGNRHCSDVPCGQAEQV